MSQYSSSLVMPDKCQRTHVCVCVQSTQRDSFSLSIKINSVTPQRTPRDMKLQISLPSVVFFKIIIIIKNKQTNKQTLRSQTHGVQENAKSWTASKTWCGSAQMFWAVSLTLSQCLWKTLGERLKKNKKNIASRDSLQPLSEPVPNVSYIRVI